MDVCSVSELNQLIKGKIANDPMLKNVMVQGTITNLKKHSSGHYYFTLKDEKAAVDVSLFYATRKPFAKEMDNGILVTITGAVSFYEPTGRLSIICNTLFVMSKSPLQLQFEELKKKLTALGYFDESHKMALPYMAKTIAIITSSSGAVLHDILNVAKQRNPLVRFKLFAVPVQGPTCGPVIARGIEMANEDPEVELIIVGRGGGSMEDLWCFNDPTLVKAIYESNTPIISAVGHETDYTLCDFAADVRSSTPSHAAELAVRPRRELEEALVFKMEYLQRTLARYIEEQRQRLERIFSTKILYGAVKTMAEQKKALRNVMVFLSERIHKTKVAEDKKMALLQEQILRSAKEQLTKKKQSMAICGEKLTLLNPITVMMRGYTRVEGTDKAIRSVEDVKTGERLTIQWHDGSAIARVEEVEKHV